MNQQPIDRIEQLAEAARQHVPELILGMRDRIEDAITDAVEAAQEDDAKAVLRIPVTIKWDLDSTEAEIVATVSTRCKSSVTVALDDPNQPPLPLDGDGDAVPQRFADVVGKAMQAAQDAGAIVTANAVGTLASISRNPRTTMTCTNGGSHE